MLRCTMITSTSLQLGLDDLLADLVHARRHGELGRLALLAYCGVRCWARQAGEAEVAERSTTLFTEQPSISRDAFLSQMDGLIAELEQLRVQHFGPAVANRFWYTQHAPLQPLAHH